MSSSSNTLGKFTPEATEGLQILDSSFCTLAVQTQKQRVTVVVRPFFILFIRESDGEVKRGTEVKRFGPFGHNYLVLMNGDEVVARTTEIDAVYVLEN